MPAEIDFCRTMSKITRPQFQRSLIALCGVLGASATVILDVDWSHETRRSRTAATVEVDVMPFLARQPETDPYIKGHYGGSFDTYHAPFSPLMYT